MAGNSDLADACWVTGTVAGLGAATGWVLADLVHRRVGVDLIAVLALAGTLIVGEFVAGALIAVMLATGRALDAAAERRASHDLRALLERAPRTARRRVGTEVIEIPLDEVGISDLLIVGPGEVVPVDGQVEGSLAALDESALTGEADPVERAVGELCPQRCAERRWCVRAAGYRHRCRAAPMPASSPWSRRPAPRAHPSSDWPTAMPRGSCRYPSRRLAWPG